ncbi:MAG: AAA-like domain-containing protein, partial [Ardenticatenaceae bacterium]
MQLIFQTGGALEADYPNYVEREADREANLAVRQGKYLYAVAPRQMGKTSLLNRLAKQLSFWGWHCCYVDLGALKGLEQSVWIEQLGGELGRQLNFIPTNQLRNPQDFKLFLLDEVAVAQGKKVALFFDEIEGLIDQPFSDAFLMMLRELHNRRESYPGQLIVAFSGATNSEALVKDPIISPFNVAEEIVLNDFTPEETQQLTEHLADLNVPMDKDISSHIYGWTSGQPHLTQRICELLETRVKKGQISAITPAEVERVVQERILDPYQRDTNLKHVLKEINRLQKPAASLWQRLKSGETVSSYETGLYELYLTGAVAGMPDGRVVIRNRIYEQVLSAADTPPSISDQDAGTLARPTDQSSIKPTIGLVTA